MEYSWAERGPATSLSAPEAARVLLAAHVAVDGKRPTLAEAELELAHEWIETKRTEAMWRHNWGNLSAGGYVEGQERLSWNGDIWRPPWFAPGEGASPRMLEIHEKMLAGREPSAFRAYGSHQDGAEGLLRLWSRPGYLPLRKAAQTGNPTAYAKAVVSTGYCTNRGCQPDQLGPSLARVVAQFRRDRVFAGLGLSRSSSPSSGAGVALLAAVVLLSSERKSS